MSKKPFEFTYNGITYIQNNRAKYCSDCAAAEVCDATRHQERRNNPCGPDDLIYSIKPTETTHKTKETKTMTTKKPGTSHGKPTAKGMKEALKPKATKTTPKPKYPAPRVALEYTPIVTPKTTKDGLHTELGFVVHEWNKERQEHAATGTKLDRALVDLKEAKAKIKELSRALEAAK